MADAHHLLKRNGVWYYRRRVPDHLVAIIGRKFVQFTLGTASKADAKKQREVWDVRWSAEFEEAERKLSGAGATEVKMTASSVLTEPAAIELIRDYVAPKPRLLKSENMASMPQRRP